MIQDITGWIVIEKIIILLIFIVAIALISYFDGSRTICSNCRAHIFPAQKHLRCICGSNKFEKQTVKEMIRRQEKEV